MTSTTHPDGSITTTEYNGIDKPVRECDALQRRTATQYTARGEVERIDYPNGTFEAKTYDPNGNLQSQTDRAGRTTGFEYDAANRLTRTIHPDPTSDDGNDSNNPVGESRYDAAGRLLEAIDENGHVTAYRYDDANRRTQVILSATASAGTATTIDEYDAAGRRSASTDGLGNRTEYRYDAAGRLIETLHPDALGDDGNPANNPRSRAEYDAAGRKTADIDPAGRFTRYAYDALGRLLAVVLPDPVSGENPPLVGGVSPLASTLSTRYAYDEMGNKVAQTDAVGHRRARGRTAHCAIATGRECMQC